MSRRRNVGGSEEQEEFSQETKREDTAEGDLVGSGHLQFQDGRDGQ